MTPTTAMGALMFNPPNYASTIAGDTSNAGGGYAYTYQDPKGSVSCLNSTVFCAAGTVAPMGYAGVGINLNQVPGSTASAFTPTGKSGVMYTLSALPTQTVIMIDNNGIAYEAPITKESAMVPWSSFQIQMADAGPATLAGPPMATHINFQAASGSFDFCVTALGFY